MGDLGRAPKGSGDRSGRDRRSVELEELEELAPYLELAREIKREVDRIAADDRADLDELSDALAQIPRSERRRVSEAVFERLPPDVQWAILERVFGDDQLREHLDRERRRALEGAERLGSLASVIDATRRSRALDTRALPEGVEVVIGLFRETDVRAALPRGQASDRCARELVLRGVEAPALKVIEDVFNPRGGLFVTREYDEETWAADRFASHTTIVVGAATDGPTGARFDPVLYPGARVDFQVDDRVIRGRLHVGSVMLGDVDVFAG